MIRRSLRAIAIALSAVACGGDDPTTGGVVSLRFLEVPENSIPAGVPFDVSVELRDGGGVRMGHAIDPVTLSINEGVVITGPQSVRASKGVATFTGLVLNKAQSDLVLRASTGTVEVSSLAFRVRAGALSLAKSSITPNAASIPANEPALLTVKLRDAYDNAVGGTAVTLSSAQAGALFAADTATGRTPGAATFSDTTRSDGTIRTLFTITGTSAVPIKVKVDQDSLVFPAIGVCPIVAYAFPGVLTGSLSSTSCMTGGVPTAPFRFTLNAPGGVSFRVISQFGAGAQVRTDPITDNIVASLQQNVATEWILPAGTFQVRLGALSGSGSFTLTGATAPANTGCITRLLVSSVTITNQRLETGDCPDYGVGTFTDKFVVFSRYACSVELTSNQFAPWLFLYDVVSGGFLDGRGGGFPGDTERLGLPSCTNQGHPLAFWVNEDEFDNGGTYTLKLTFTPPAGGGVGATAVDLAAMQLAATPEMFNTPANRARIAFLKDSLRSVSRARR